MSLRHVPTHVSHQLALIGVAGHAVADIHCR
ncbi:Ms4533A family Cys-rich leader peptide [Streptomyces sp. M19]